MFAKIIKGIIYIANNKIEFIFQWLFSVALFLVDFNLTCTF